MFSEDIYGIHGQDNSVLVASVCDRDRSILDEYLNQREREDHEDSREFRQMRSMMQGNKGVRL
jgi:hypothetical protein